MRDTTLLSVNRTFNVDGLLVVSFAYSDRPNFYGHGISQLWPLNTLLCPFLATCGRLTGNVSLNRQDGL